MARGSYAAAIRVKAFAVIGNPQADTALTTVQNNLHLLRLCVFETVVERLLRHPIKGQLEIRFHPVKRLFVWRNDLERSTDVGGGAGFVQQVLQGSRQP